MVRGHSTMLNAAYREPASDRKGCQPPSPACLGVRPPTRALGVYPPVSPYSKSHLTDWLRLWHHGNSRWESKGCPAGREGIDSRLLCLCTMLPYGVIPPCRRSTTLKCSRSGMSEERVVFLTKNLTGAPVGGSLISAQKFFPDGNGKADWTDEEDVAHTHSRNCPRKKRRLTRRRDN